MKNDLNKTFGLKPDAVQNVVNIDQKLSYINDQYNNANNITRANTLHFFNRVGCFNDKKDLCNFNLVELENLFKRGLNINSQASFDYTKTVVRKYYEWCADKQLISKRILGELFDNFKYEYVYDAINIRQKLFSDFDDLENGIRTIMGKLSPIDPIRYYMQMTFMYLNWFGFDTKEICFMKKENVNYTNNTISFDKKTIKIPQSVCDIIQAYSDATGYAVNGSTLMLQYRNSNYLIRKTTKIKSSDKSSSQYSLSNVSGKIGVFTECAQNLEKGNRYYQHDFCLENIRTSGCFLRIYDYCKQQHMIIEDLKQNVLEELLYEHITAGGRRNLTVDYYYWKQSFNK